MVISNGDLNYEDLMGKLITITDTKDGSDIHISPNNKLYIRIKGKITPQEEVFQAAVSPQDTVGFYEYLKNTQDGDSKKYIESELHRKGHIGFSVSLNGCRFRVNVAKNNGGYYIVMRIIKATPPALENLNFNKRTMEGLKFASTRGSGLFLVTGATGSGKSTTLAAIIRYINERAQKNIITLEDPIEYEHESIKCHVIQKELGRDMYDFKDGLKSALREDPDILLIGEIRDWHTLENALEASETGHLVFGTLHTNSAVDTIERLASMAPDGAESLIRQKLSGSLIGIIAQKLTLDRNEKRIPVWELLIKNPGIAAQIKEGQDAQIKAMLDNTEYSQSYNRTILQYWRGNRITRETAYDYAGDSRDLDLDSPINIPEDQRIPNSNYNEDPNNRSTQAKVETNIETSKDIIEESNNTTNTSEEEQKSKGLFGKLSKKMVF